MKFRHAFTTTVVTAEKNGTTKTFTYDGRVCEERAAARALKELGAIGSIVKSVEYKQTVYEMEVDDFIKAATIVEDKEPTTDENEQ